MGNENLEKKNQISFSCFGKKKGFSVFAEDGEILSRKNLKELFYDYIQLKISYSKYLTAEDILLQVIRFQDKGNSDYTILTYFKSSLDDFGRDSYYGASIMFRNCFPKYLFQINELLAELVAYSASIMIKEVNTDINTLESSSVFNSIEIEDYNYNYSVVKNEEILIDCFPESDYFLTRLFFNQLGSSKKVYFTSNPEVFLAMKEEGVNTKKYQELLEEITQSWEDKMYDAKDKHSNYNRKIQLLRQEEKDLDKSIHSKIVELEKVMDEIKEEQKEYENFLDKKKEIKEEVTQLSKELTKIKQKMKMDRKKIETLKSSLVGIGELFDNQVERCEDIGKGLRNMKKL